MTEPTGGGPAVLWFRRDLRLGDHPALDAAARSGPVIALFVLDGALLEPAGAPRVAYLVRTLRALDDQLRSHGTELVIRSGRPEQIVPSVVAQTGATSVHISADFGPYGAARDARVAAALGDVPLVATGSPYAVSPGRVLTNAGTPFRVFSAFSRAWVAHGWRAPAGSDPAAVEWASAEWASAGAVGSEPTLDQLDDSVAGMMLPPAGEAAAMSAWVQFCERELSGYGAHRDVPGADATSRLSPHLKYGTIHPRTMLAQLGPDDETFRRELAWREFYADVLHHVPTSARTSFQPRMEHMTYDEGPDADHRFDAWASGHTGYPLVDAGMRQLLAQGWMHNRVRMITASFLVKHLHIDWRRGARHFMAHLVDGDLASNQHGWQWTAGTGTDAAPYFRIFNPVSQAKRFDPDGRYIRHWVPELAELSPREIHEPWKRPDGTPAGYPAPIIDLASERAEALTRYQLLRA